MRATAIGLLLLGLAACAEGGGKAYDGGLGYPAARDAGQPEYTYHGCANEDGTCPRSATAHCAVGLAAQPLSICTEDYDCELVWLTERCLSLCGPIGVGFDDLEASQTAKQSEINRYCAMGSCAEQACPDAGGTWVAACEMGFCAAVHPDGGS